MHQRSRLMVAGDQRMKPRSYTVPSRSALRSPRRPEPSCVAEITPNNIRAKVAPYRTHLATRLRYSSPTSKRRPTVAAPGQFGERSRLANARHPVIRTRVIASKLTPDDGMRQLEQRNRTTSA